ncbi:MAG: hypothetical protein ISN29_07095 [Gammaproteobacteria bacterium AqS3]|nr:hypothetical protein [Gammaproteobacteria bacterium AqS3]
MPDTGWLIILIGAIICPDIPAGEILYWGSVFAASALFRVLVAFDAFGEVPQKMGVISKPLFVADLHLVILGSAGMILVELLVYPFYGNKFASGSELLIFLSALAARSIYRRAIIKRSETEKNEIT